MPRTPYTISSPHPPPLCSVLIPSRARPERLLAAIRSVWSTPDVEVLVRLDSDDLTATTPDLTTNHTLIDELEAIGVRVLVGERKSGYDSLIHFYAELSAIATAPWIWIMNDDAHIANAVDVVDVDVTPTVPFGRRHRRRARWRTVWELGQTWIDQLRRIPTTGVIVQAEMYKLGQSCYFDGEGSAFPIVPRDVWKRFGYERPEGPIDAWLDRLLRLDNGWRTQFLIGVAAVHERDDDAELARHRQM
jgi:hypothetical protein